jgi:hypothetical protein
MPYDFSLRALRGFQCGARHQSQNKDKKSQNKAKTKPKQSKNSARLRPYWTRQVATGAAGLRRWAA